MKRIAAIVVASGALVAACRSESSAPLASPVVSSVTPSAGATNVAASAPIIVAFNMAMMTGMELTVALHAGTITGPQVAGTAVWSSDRRTLTFTPLQPLRPKTAYAFHLGGSMLSASGQALNHSQCQQLGAQPVTGAMMGGGGMGPGMMGSGWQGTKGTYGMIFTFTTA